MRDEFQKTITDPNAPERLKGKTVTAILTEKSLNFVIDLPEDLTPNEIGYFRLFTGEVADMLRDKLGLSLTEHAPRRLEPGEKID